MDLQSIKNRFNIIGNAPALNHALNTAVQVAATDLTVLIVGESGVGKEVFSQIIHSLSSRKHNPFIAVNCGAIPEGTIDSELFGHEKGSFTGAVDSRKGYFETVSGGKITISGSDVTDLAPFDRPVNTVFQDYALFPHMSIQDNVEYGLRTRKVKKEIRAKQAAEAIDSVKLSHVAARLPHQLSGGQRQRIALARALVLRPKVLLLDEPLGALDKQLREEMQVELKKIQREAGITFIFVTHDQEEAMRMSDRIAVFNEGRVEQIGTPEQVYEAPKTKFVASFLGVSNLFSGEIAKQLFGKAEMVNIRPEKIRLQPYGSKIAADEVGVSGEIIEAAYVGANTLFSINTESGMRLSVTRSNQELPDQINRFKSGDRVLAVWLKSQVATIPN